MTFNEYYQTLIDYGICSEETLRIITDINGNNIETLNDILYATTGYHTWDQYIG
jgi:hypothetical protein